jgi:hypothetical protein
MDDSIFKKMRVTPGMNAALLFEPPEYPKFDRAKANKSGKPGTEGGKPDFVHLFVKSRTEFSERFAAAAEAASDSGLFWLSYPKSSGKEKYDINRDSLWDLVLPLGWHPVAQISLDEKWSAIRLKRNEQGVAYERPANIRK